MNVMNIEEAQCLAHQLASEIQREYLVFHVHNPSVALNKKFANKDRNEREKAFLTFLLEGDSAFAVKKNALIQEVRLATGWMQTLREKNGTPKELVMEHLEAIEHIFDKTVINAQLRVKHTEQYLQEVQKQLAQRAGSDEVLLSEPGLKTPSMKTYGA